MSRSHPEPSLGRRAQAGRPRLKTTGGYPVQLRRLVHFIDQALWKDSPLGSRSKECTPLYIERYAGPRSREIPRRISAPHDFWEITAVYSGYGKLIGKNEVTLAPGVVCLMPAGIRHDEVSPEGMDTIWIGFCGQYSDRLKLTAPATVRDEHLIKQIEQLWLFCLQPRGSIGPELDAGTAAIVTCLVRLMEDPRIDIHTDHIERAIKYMMEHFAESIAIPKLAAQTGCSTGYFQRTFRKRTGKTPVEFLADLRLRQACHLLWNTDLRISEIAERTGYQSVSYFSRIFSRHIGVNPSNYQEAKVNDI